MSTTNWLILDVDVSGNDQSDGQVQLSYTIINSVLQAGAILSYRVNDNSHPSAIATTPSSVASTSSGTDTLYAVSSFTVTDFRLPSSGVFNGGKYDAVGFTLTIDSTGNATLTSGTFTPDDDVKGLGDDDLSWSADTNAPFPEQASKKASGKY